MSGRSEIRAQNYCGKRFLLKLRRTGSPEGRLRFQGVGSSRGSWACNLRRSRLPLGLESRAMATPDKMRLSELEDLATKLRHAIARNPDHSRMEPVALENVKQWLAIR